MGKKDGFLDVKPDLGIADIRQLSKSYVGYLSLLWTQQVYVRTIGNQVYHFYAVYVLLGNKNSEMS